MGAGFFLTFEGADGAGKSTQARRLADRLRVADREVVTTREPGGTEGAEAIRALLLEGAAERWSAETEILLFTAARRDHWERLIGPALDRGAVVICDRFVDSTRVYQGAEPAARALVDRLHALMIGREADLTLLLELEADAAHARAAAGTPDRFEARDGGFRARIAAGFRAIAEADPARVVPIDAAGSPEAVAERVWAAVSARLPEAGLGAAHG